MTVFTVARSRHEEQTSMLQPGSWTVGRTKASGSLLAEEYGRILSFFDECGPEHGPRRVQEEMGVPAEGTFWNPVHCGG